jgi:diguanylate cyclase (GGDEF)-like protein
MNSKEINYIENQIIYDFAGQVGISIQNLMLFDRVKKMATIDGLTGVFNRIHFTGMAELAFRELQKSNKNLSLVMMDIDNFKLVNDRYGHLAGDKVLQELVKCLKEVLGPNSIIGRYGGEEFLILLKETSIQEAYQIAEKMRNAVENLSVCLAEKEVVKFTISIGVSTTNKDISDIWSLVEKADQALYLSKENGKNLVNIC